jgi:hypothetical protein
MNPEYFWAAFGLIWIFGWVTVWYLRRRAIEARSLKLRELLHRERLAAMDKGVPLPEIPLEEEADPVWLRPEAERMRAAWLRRAALFLGLLFLFGGLGMAAGFYWAPDRGFHAMWTLGFIPTLSGGGLLLYAALASWLGVDRAE